ncbi:AAEL004197-PA, partial [Aedes aegypti]
FCFQIELSSQSSEGGVPREASPSVITILVVRKKKYNQNSPGVGSEKIIWASSAVIRRPIVRERERE